MRKWWLFAAVVAAVALTSVVLFQWRQQHGGNDGGHRAGSDMPVVAPRDAEGTARRDAAAGGAAADTAQQTAGKPSPVAAIRPPSFDVVRVGPERGLVVAGRAVPGSTVVILRDGTRLADVVADATGAWVYVPDTALPPGKHRFRLRQIVDGDKTFSAKDVLVIVPEPFKDIAGAPAQAGSGALAMTVDPEGQGASRILQTPSDNDSKPELYVESLDYTARGRITLSGKAPPQSQLVLYVDGVAFARFRSGQEGRWQFTGENYFDPGDYTVRVDQVDEEGTVQARAERSFAIAPAIGQVASVEGEAEAPAVVIASGDNLWRIARKVYGKGRLYTVIFEANQEQIRDPDLIYPGQVFDLPELPEQL